MLLGQPAVLVPSPNVAGDHQAKNAKSMVETGAAELLEESDIEEKFSEIVTALINNQERLQKMNMAMKSLAKPEAANTIAKEIFTIAQKKTHE